MIASNLLVNTSKVLNSDLYPLTDASLLQIGKYYVVVKSKNKHDYYHLHENVKFEVIQILSTTPKLDKSKIGNTLTYDSLLYKSDDWMFLPAYFIGKYLPKDIDSTLAKVANNTNYYKFNDGWNGLTKNGNDHSLLKYGWMYCEVEYLDVLSNTKHTRKVCCGKTGFVEHIYFTNINDEFPSREEHYELQDRIYTSDAFEYDTHEITEKNYYHHYDHFDPNTQLIDDINKIRETELYEILVKNFRYFLAKAMISNNDKIDDKDTVQIDGLTWYNGFYKSQYGITNRSYLFYDYIPRGWRLPTISELQSMLDKHPLLKKETYSDDEFIRRRNNAGMECSCNSNMFESYGRYNLFVSIKDYNNYSDENCYFPRQIKAFDIVNQNTVYMSPVERKIRNRRPYLIMLVKMTDAEIQEQDKWVNSVITKSSLYHNIDDIYKEYGIDNVDDIESIEFDMSIDGVKKSFRKEKGNYFLDALKEAISKYAGNNDVYNAAKLKITFEDTDGKQVGSLNFDSSAPCNIRDYLTKVSPLLCRDLCMHNINDISELTYVNSYHNNYGVGHFAHIEKNYNIMQIHTDMYFYILNALNLIGINYGKLIYDPKYIDEDFNNYIKKTGRSIYFKNDYEGLLKNGVDRPGTAYMTKMTLHLSGGKSVTINSLPIECFNSSEIYLHEISNEEFYADNVKVFKKTLFKSL